MTMNGRALFLPLLLVWSPTSCSHDFAFGGGTGGVSGSGGIGSGGIGSGGAGTGGTGGADAGSDRVDATEEAGVSDAAAPLDGAAMDATATMDRPIVPP